MLGNKTMSKENKVFRRELNNLNNFTESCWWKTIVNDDDLHIGIRENYLNVYFHGCSIAKLTPTKNGISGTTSNAFLDKNSQEANSGYSPYTTKSKNESDPVTCNGFAPLNDIDAIKRNIEKYHEIEKNGATREKTAIQQYLVQKSYKGDILDLECTVSAYSRDGVWAAMVNDAEDKLNRKIPRIDLVELVEEEDAFKLNFIEVKHIRNPELVSHSTPKVVQQMSDYKKLLELYREEFISAYQDVCEIQKKLALSNKNPTVTKVVSGLSEKKLTVNLKPILLILKDKNENEPSNWEVHKKKLECGDFDLKIENV